MDKSSYYTITHPNEFKINWKAFYDKADDLTASTRGEVRHYLDIAYGDDPKQKLDLYLPKAKQTSSPVFVFLHGGGFREGDRAHYGYVSRPFAKNGILTVVASYRLTPKFRFPNQPDDAKQILAWVFHNISSYGGDPMNIYIGGHSAGAILSAFVSLKGDWLTRMGLPSDLIKGCVPTSGPYDLRDQKDTTEYAPDPSIRLEASPLLNIENPPPRTVIAYGSLEDKFVNDSQELAKGIRSKGMSAEVVVLDAMAHDETALALGDENSKLFQAVLRMIVGTP